MEKTNQLSDVPVSGNSRRLKNINEFKDLLFGTDRWGKKAILKNYYGLIFGRQTKTIKRKVQAIDFEMQKKYKNNNEHYQWSADSSLIFNYVQVFTVKT